MNAPALAFALVPFLLSLVAFGRAFSLFDDDGVCPRRRLQAFIDFAAGTVFFYLATVSLRVAVLNILR